MTARLSVFFQCESGEISYADLSQIHSNYQFLQGFQLCKKMHFDAFLNKTLLQNLTPRSKWSPPENKKTPDSVAFRGFLQCGSGEIRTLVQIRNK